MSELWSKYSRRRFLFKTAAAVSANSLRGLSTSFIRPNARTADFSPLYAAYSEMYGRPGIENLNTQKEIHFEACNGDASVHTTNDFVLWHRAFLFYHERILRAMVPNECVSLPYWEWDSDCHEDKICPKGYAAANFQEFRNDLYRSAWQTLACSPPQMLACPPIMESCDFSRKGVERVIAKVRQGGDGGPVTIATDPIHQNPHLHLGWGTHYNLDVAAADPLFYAHHANIDRIANQTFGATAPCSDRIYKFVDVDPGGQFVWRSTSLAPFKDLKCCGYSYQNDYFYDQNAYSFQPLSKLKKSLHPASRVRAIISFDEVLPTGSYNLLLSKNQKAQIVNPDHHGGKEFVVWMDPKTFREKAAKNLSTVDGHRGRISHAELFVRNR